jgi:tartrate-resistant acid phosphatase type 5
MRRVTFFLLLGAVISCAAYFLTPLTHAAAPAAEKPAAPKLPAKPTTKPVVAHWVARPFPLNEVNLIAMGDWGSGGKEEKEVAKGLANYVEKLGVQFNGLLSLGDNFYVPLKDEDDYQFQTVFEDMWDAKRINFPFYGALGNHDYEKNKQKIEMAYAAKHPDSRWKMPSRWYRLDLPVEKPMVTILMLDSNKPQMTAEDWLAQLRWIEEQLSQPKGTKWTIACAHHPLFSNGAHGDNGVLQVHWGPLFKKYKLDFYVCGHDHDLQELQMPEWSTTFVLAGGGGKKPTKMRRDLRGPFSKSLNGFSHLHLFPDRAIVQFVNAEDGAIVHQIDRTHDGKVSLVIKGGNDKATNQPLKVLLGLDGDDKKPDPKKPADDDDPDP